MIEPTSVPCPWCHAAPGEPCAVRMGGRERPARSPHPARVRAANDQTPPENRPEVTL